MTDVRDQRRKLWMLLLLFTFIGVSITVDLVSDYAAGTSYGHVIAEGLVVLAAASGIAVLVRRLFDLRGERSELKRQLDVSQRDAQRWRDEARELLEGLGAAIERQFERWELTPAEREVALLLLKGLSLKEVADIRGVSDRTVRQQAHVVYKKAGLGGRADLSAFFLEDLLLPGSIEQTGSDKKSDTLNE